LKHVRVKVWCKIETTRFLGAKKWSWLNYKRLLMARAQHE
jgi:hypothetical protein